jgi:hypothetical protein
MNHSDWSKDELESNKLTEAETIATQIEHAGEMVKADLSWVEFFANKNETSKAEMFLASAWKWYNRKCELELQTERTLAREIVQDVASTPKKITAAVFKKATGHDPIQDDLERSNCEHAGEPGHWDCGWCNQCNRPYFMCRHSAPRKEASTPKPAWMREAITDGVSTQAWFDAQPEVEP